MPCLIGCMALMFPRFALVLVWLFGGNFLSGVYPQWYWPLLGFLFLPFTTLAFAYASNSLGLSGEVPPLGWLLTAVAFAADVGVIGGGQSGAKNWRKR